MIERDDKPLFLDQLGTHPLVTDGSMATELALRGFTETPTDLYNLKNPVIVESIHRDFVEAGARLIQANTECANRLMLERVNLADKVYEINRKGVWIARCAALHKAFVAGVVGPVGKFLSPLGSISRATARQAFIDQIIALLDGGADVLMLKSFIDIEELELAIDAAKFVNATTPIIAHKTFPEDGSVLATSFPKDIANRLIDKGVAVIGTNGTVGPQRMVDIVQALHNDRTPVSAQPDISIPTLINGKAIYNAKPEYVAESIKKISEMGAAIVGADGGASVEHIRAIASMIAETQVGSKPGRPKRTKPIEPAEDDAGQHSDFFAKLGSEFVSTVELDIPRGLDLSSVIEGARYLKERNITAINISDGARARLRMSSIAIAQIVQRAVGIECLAHLACRDRNMVGLQAELLGAHALDVKNILAVTGDPAQIGDYPYATSVYDVDSVGLIRALAKMNQGLDLMGNPIGAKTNFCIACACNPAADNLDREVARLERKVAEGAHVAFSQPVFDMQTLDRFRNRTHALPLRFVLGVIPLRSRRHAQFLHYEVPGIEIPEWVRTRMAEASARKEGAQEGIRIAVEFLREARASVDGVYLMPPFQKYSMAVDILEQL